MKIKIALDESTAKGCHPSIPENNGRNYLNYFFWFQEKNA